MRILVATNFSVRSHRALRRAGLLAGPRRGKLMPMHVVEGLGTRQVAQDLREAQRMILEQIAVVPELFRAWCEPIVIGGDPAGAVLDAANAWEIDLIVVGAPSAPTERTSGETLRTLLRASPCPVLVVRQPVEGPYRRVLAPVDLSDTSTRALRRVGPLGLADDAEMTVLHAFRAPATTKLWASGISQDHVDGYVESWRTGFAEELDGVLTREGLGRRDWRRRVEEGRPRDVIPRVAMECRADLVAVGTHRRTGLARALRGSVAEDLLSTPGPDVLVVPPPRRTPGRPTWLRSGSSRSPDGQRAPGIAVT
jgi:nucleotide-binding universal stress UspA family protein